MKKNKEEMAECLWSEINKAIVNSPNVKDCLHIMQDMGMIDYLSRHDLILDGRLLIQRILKESRIQLREGNRVEPARQQYVDVTKRLTRTFKLSLN